MAGSPQRQHQAPEFEHEHEHEHERDHESELTQIDATWRYINPLAGKRQRQRIARALHEGTTRQVQRVELLAPAELPRLAQESLLLLLVGGIIFALCIWLGSAIGAGPVPLPQSRGAAIALIIVTNIVAYALMIPIHEAIHALVILALGGKPRFGLALPLAAYCTAPRQLFSRNGYIAVALAPALLLSALGIVCSLLVPHLGLYLWFGFTGNISGAAGDLMAVRQTRNHPSTTLIADTETGFDAYAIETSE